MENFVSALRVASVGRAHRLVGRDQHETLDLRGERGQCHGAGAQHVGARALDLIFLHHRHVLVGRRVQDRIDPLFIEHTLDTRAVIDRSQPRDKADPRRLDQWRQLVVDRVERVLALLEQDDPGRVALQQLTAKFRADRAPCPGHHHDATGIGARDVGGVEIHHATAEELVRRDGAKANTLVPGDDVDVGRQRADLDTEFGDLVGDGLYPMRFRRRHREEHMAHLMAMQFFAQEVRGKDRQPRDHDAAQFRIVIDKEDRAQLARQAQRRGKLDAGRAGAINGDPVGDRVMVRGVGHQLHPDNAHHQRRGKEQGREGDRNRARHQDLQHEPCRNQNQAENTGRKHDPQYRPPLQCAKLDPGNPEQNEAHRRRDRHVDKKRRVVPRCPGEKRKILESQGQHHVEAEQDENGVEAKDDVPLHPPGRVGKIKKKTDWQQSHNNTLSGRRTIGHAQSEDTLP